MLTLAVTLPTAPSTDPGAAVDVFSNIDAAGNVTAELKATPDNARPIPLYPGATADAHPWGSGAWGDGPWGGLPLAYVPVQFSTRPVHFGRVQLTARTRDAAGTYQAGADAVTVIVVNSPPYAPTGFRRTTGTAPAFTFREPAQLEVTT